jgi:hypothetical protein
MLFGLICVFDFDEFDSYRTNLYKLSFEQSFSKLHPNQGGFEIVVLQLQ